MIPAVISVCLALAPAQCETRQFRVEPRACSVPELRAEAPLAGQWQPVTVRIQCSRGR